MGHHHSSKDNRSNSMNPNNPSCHASKENRSNQLNPEHDAYWQSRGSVAPLQGQPAGLTLDLRSLQMDTSGVLLESIKCPNCGNDVPLDEKELHYKCAKCGRVSFPGMINR